jgi:uncharacterized Zn-binding protein involved in type VI secretion
MAKLTYKGAMSKGQDAAPPTALTKLIQCSKTYVGGKLVGVVGDRFEDHTPYAGGSPHKDAQRQISAGASKTYFEGNLAARVNDPIADGDAVADGNAKTNVE